MKDEERLEICMIQKSVFPRPLPLEIICGEDMQYGIREKERFLNNRCDRTGFTMYLPRAIGRGIRVTWTPEETQNVFMTLVLPATSEEIGALYAAAARISRCWTSSLYVNGQGMTMQDFLTMTEDLEVTNLRLLHEHMQEILRTGTEEVFDCVRYQLTFGTKEAELFHLLNSTEQFRDWLHTRQQTAAYIPEKEITDDGRVRTYIYTFPSGVPVIFPQKTEVEASGNTIALVRLYDSEQETTRGYLPFPEFYDHLTAETVHYFDCGRVYIDAHSGSELADMIYGEQYGTSER